jgi:hypothetical protein
MKRRRCVSASHKLMSYTIDALVDMIDVCIAVSSTSSLFFFFEIFFECDTPGEDLLSFFLC